MEKIFRLLAVSGGLMAGLARADNDVSPTASGGRITTNGYDDGLPLLTPNLRVFGYGFGEDPDDPFFAEDPGFHVLADSHLTVGSRLTVNVLNGGQFGLAGNLTYWNGSGPVSFSAVPDHESIDLQLGSFSVRADENLGAQAGFSLGTINSVPEYLHEHLFAFLNGHDQNSIPAAGGGWGMGDGVQATDGIYLLALELTSDDGVTLPSLPFFIVYNNGLDDSLPDNPHVLAIDWVTDHLAAVPEPSTFALAVCGAAGMALATVRRRRFAIV